MERAKARFHQAHLEKTLRMQMATWQEARVVRSYLAALEEHGLRQKPGRSVDTQYDRPDLSPRAPMPTARPRQRLKTPQGWTEPVRPRHR
jgi:hypothetical protein